MQYWHGCHFKRIVTVSKRHNGRLLQLLGMEVANDSDEELERKVEAEAQQ